MSLFYKKIKNFFFNALIGDRILKNGEVIDGKRIWLISDMHFGHKNIIRWCRQDCFRNVNQMNKRMISNWNFHVGQFDRVFCLGDFGDFRFKRQLKGRITIAKGNHDHKQWNRQYQLKYRDLKFLLIHDPDDGANWFSGDWIIHGHKHINSPFIDITKKRINVSVEAINYTPINMEYLYHIIQEAKDFKDDRWFL